MGEPTQPSAVDSALNNVKDKADVLEEMMGDIVKRLQPILYDAPQVLANEATGGEKQPEACQLVRRLNDVLDVLIRVQSQGDEILARTQL
jgi:hypothetical protein